MRSKSMRSKSMRSKSKRMRSKSKRMRMRSKSTRKHKKSMRSKSKSTQKHRHRRHRKTMYGGHAPPPWVGSPYNAGDHSPNGNFLPQSPNGVPSGLPISPMSTSPQFGQRGGGFMNDLSMFASKILPDDVVNLTRSIPAAGGNLMDRFNGNIPSASSQVYPTQQPLALLAHRSAGTVPQPNINSAYTRAVQQVPAL